MITIKSEKEIQTMQEGGKILADIIKEVARKVRPGITTNYLNKVARDLVLKFGAKPSFENYMGFPTALCTSVNETIVHGVPGGLALKEGDIISLDLGILYKGYHTDMAITVPVGKTAPEAARLIKVARESLEKGIKEANPGKKFSDIGKAVQKYVEGEGFGVVRELCGHGIGKKLHEDPQILNYLTKGEGGEIIKEGMVFCIEPMITIGDWHVKKAKDSLAYETADRSLAAHFEHTIAVTRTGRQVLTEREQN
jgi:methionyl aminopeptidase